VQADWADRQKTRGPLRWRPFQLAFMLLNLPGLADPARVSVADPAVTERAICDLLWFPTGGGKTEAYLGLAAFTLALRRLRSDPDADGHRTGGGTSVISRYTLRLLTIQQFRRALGMITACEVLRVEGLGTGPAGWRPAAYPGTDDFLWGGSRFSAGLWVGQGVTPNSLLPIRMQYRTVAGAIDMLRGPGPAVEHSSEPAQILNCPCCNTILAVPEEGLQQGAFTLHYIVSCPVTPTWTPSSVASPITITGVSIQPCPSPGYYSVCIAGQVTRASVPPAAIRNWWIDAVEPSLRPGVDLEAASPVRPGYFITQFENQQRHLKDNGFEILCPNPACDLHRHEWAEKVPISVTGILPGAAGPGTPALVWQETVAPFRSASHRTRLSCVPIPAYTVDAQVYHRLPSLLVATVDKFARLAFEGRAGALFGHIDTYHAHWGYYRQGCPPLTWNTFPRTYQPLCTPQTQNVPVRLFRPPDLILQDELHLIEGPLGSMMGLYETAIDLLCQGQDAVRPKYIASTATVRQAASQAQALFNRRLAQFPPPGLTIDDGFFLTTARDPHPLDVRRAGRLYAGVCAPGRGAQTPIIRIWTALLQSVYLLLQARPGVADIDNFWTLVGYFNAVRELAGAATLYRQDIPQRLNDWVQFGRAHQARPLPPSSDDTPLELSSRADSLRLPGLLQRLEKALPGAAEDVALATSMFSTGVDVDRLGLLVMHGQPKATASYIQATGRVGRKEAGLVVTFLRASRPRDLNHYEFFTGYHRALYRSVEPVTVAPFAPRARERGLGPLLVILLRHADRIQGYPVTVGAPGRPIWVEQRLTGAPTFSGAPTMAGARNTSPEVLALPAVFEERALSQPAERRPGATETRDEAASWLDRWQQLAQLYSTLLYAEATLINPPSVPVVLGDPAHQLQKIDVAFKNAPQSLRDIEATTTFGP
jgi:hypothetical protein